jgi:CheY-like chemotaxis protein
MADPSQLERLLMNLCRNASDAMPQGGRIAIRLTLSTTTPRHAAAAGLRDAGRYAELSVTDTGTGMSEQTRTRLFEPFFTTKTSHQGTGLGLAIVYTIVKQYGGHIEVASELEAGTTFRIHLPLCSERGQLEAPQARHALRAGNPRNTNENALRIQVVREERNTVLVVDDDDALRNQSVRALELAGFQTLVARSAEEALRVLASSPELPEVAITDVQMPGMDGLQLAVRMLAELPELKLVFVSGECSEALLSTEGFNQNAVFLQKPFTTAALLKEVEGLLQCQSIGERDSGVFQLGGADPVEPIDELERPR